MIKKVTKNDAGEYTCKAFQVSTTGSSFEEKTIRLNIKHKPYFIHRNTYGSRNVTYGYVGGMVNLTCEATAEPPANFTWSANNKKFSHKNHHIFTANHISMLQIMIKNSTAFGKYRCEAKNELGTISREIQLKEGTKPDPPSRYPPSTATTHWTAANHPPPLLLLPQLAPATLPTPTCQP